MTRASRKALFLDRDGVINVDSGYVHTPEQTQWVPGIFELCSGVQELGYDLIVVTNQAGIARGYYSESTFLDYSRWQQEQFLARGIALTATYFCPHHPSEGLGEFRQDCNCRKPRPGMLLRARDELGLNLSRSALLGDKESDLGAAIAAGVRHRRLLTDLAVAGESAITMADALEWLQSLERE